MHPFSDFCVKGFWFLGQTNFRLLLPSFLSCETQLVWISMITGPFCPPWIMGKGILELLWRLPQHLVSSLMRTNSSSLHLMPFLARYWTTLKDPIFLEYTKQLTWKCKEYKMVKSQPPNNSKIRVKLGFLRHSRKAELAATTCENSLPHSSTKICPNFRRW